jgi:hypothetical protein
MAKKISAVGSLALIMVIYLIWKNPTGTADLINSFFSALGGFVSDLWDRLITFVDNLGG